MFIYSSTLIIYRVYTLYVCVYMTREKGKCIAIISSKHLPEIKTVSAIRWKRPRIGVGVLGGG